MLNKPVHEKAGISSECQQIPATDLILLPAMSGPLSWRRGAGARAVLSIAEEQVTQGSSFVSGKPARLAPCWGVERTLSWHCACEGPLWLPATPAKLFGWTRKKDSKLPLIFSPTCRLID